MILKQNLHEIYYKPSEIDFTMPTTKDITSLHYIWVVSLHFTEKKSDVNYALVLPLNDIKQKDIEFNDSML